MPLDPAQRHQTEQDPAMPKLTETQTIILSAGAQRPNNIALPLPKGLHGAAAKMAVTKMIAHGWLQEVDANLRQCELLWRETGDGHGTTLVVTDAGLLAIGVKPVVVTTAMAILKQASVPPEAKQTTQRAGTKQAMLIEMLQSPDGATIAEIVGATGWLAHTARGVISGVLKKKLGLAITTTKVDVRGLVYRSS
ncbi:DUF3489 domain-containing protein [Yoonia vestfoldensis]|uniref:DUF3489 domain-containing protein n=1 Tax=Yoonia vestfoldensis TaxID=245188 RepID=UPI0003789B25|nr:DUF3489 domain-containing protein [Yoonia vestfoldensis]